MLACTVLGLVALAVAFGLLASSRWAGERGWFYNKHNPRPSGSGVPPAAFGQVFKPDLEHTVDEMRSEQIRADQDEAGDDNE
jgi:hypothetical protein